MDEKEDIESNDEINTSSNKSNENEQLIAINQMKMNN